MRTALNGILVAAALPISTTGHVGDQHSAGRAENDGGERVEARGEQHGRDLRLVADLGEEERDDGDAEHAPARYRRRFGVVERVGLQRPRRDGEEGERDDPAQRTGREPGAHEIAEVPRERVVGERGDEDAGDDRHGLPEPRRQHQREELRLVADFAECHDSGRNEEGFHGIRSRLAMLAGAAGVAWPAANPAPPVGQPGTSNRLRTGWRMMPTPAKVEL